MTKNFIGNKKKMEPYKGTLIGPSLDFSAETLQARQEQNDILKILNDKKKSAKNTLSSKVLQENEDCPG